MELKSIENLDIVNLTNCDQEPISIPGSIQPHGFMLVLDQQYIIRLCSANLPQYNLTAEQVLNKHFDQLLDREESEKLTAYLERRDFETSKPHASRLNGMDYHTTVHVSGPHIILELEPFPDGSLELSNMYLQTKKFTTILSRTVGLKNLCQYISEEIRQVTGYDRVMIYKFDEQYNGEVFAEARNEALEPFLGLHYPHTDIPAQARELYLRNLMRMIADVHYKPVPIVTLDTTATNSNVDMSHSVLRSVSPIHIEYLKNMGVSGTLTISLILEGKLWGLVACHHYSGAHNIPHYIRLSALLQAHFLTSQIRVQEVTLDYGLKVELDKRLQHFLTLLDEHSLREESNIVSKELYELTNANGVCVITDNALQCYGDVPAAAEIKQLVAKLTAAGEDHAYSSNVAHDHKISLSNQVAGFLYHRMDAATAIMWFRNELTKEIHWAGDPDKSIVHDKNGLSPRKSFALWKEKVTGHSNEWHITELNVAGQCVYAVQKHFSLIKDKKIQKMQTTLLGRLRQANEELENINWISTHDLKEPLRKIRVFASILLDDEKHNFDKDAVHLLNRMSSAVDRMQKLLDDLLSFSRVKNGAYKYELCDLNTLIANVREDDEDVIRDKAISFDIGELPQLHCLPVLLGQLFANLISNSIKFSRPGVPLVISIQSSMVHDSNDVPFCEIIIADNGKGFENKYNDLIFQVFQRLEKRPEIEGTGIGLAICKKIAAIHKGSITAEGVPDKGATFRILLPYDPASIPDEF